MLSVRVLEQTQSERMQTHAHRFRVYVNTICSFLSNTQSHQKEKQELYLHRLVVRFHIPIEFKSNRFALNEAQYLSYRLLHLLN